MICWNKVGYVAGGFLLGSYGLKLLGSRDAKSLYTHCTAAVLRMKDEVVKDYTTIKENAEDIGAAAKDINEKRRMEYEAQMIEDARAILAEAEAAAEKG
ncbi:MAG: hypothetical protein IJ123_02760 [Blautia sp.]|nr:hypothetical protein [Blautia sp.]